MKKKRIRNRLTNKVKNSVVALYKNGRTYKHISTVLGLTTGSVGSVLKQSGVVRKQTVAGFPIPDKDPRKLGSHGIGYWHMNLDIKPKPLGVLIRSTERVSNTHGGNYPNKSSILMS